MKKTISLTLIITLLFSIIGHPTIALSAGILYKDFGLYFDAATGTITDCDQSLEGVLNIPEKIDGVTVTAIGNRAFQDCEKLTDINIPGTVTHLGTLAFANCYALTEMTIPKSIVTGGDGNWFNDSYNLKKIIFEDGTTEILPCCMWGADGLQEVYIPRSVKKIGRMAFYWCNKIKNITLPEGLEVLGDSCFEGCSELSSIEVPSSVKEIGHSAFDGCGLTEVTLHEGLEKMGDGAFSNCYKLTHIDFPSTLKSIGWYAFTGVPLKNVFLPKNLENSERGGWFWGLDKINSIVFEDGITHIPQDALDGANAGIVIIPNSAKTIEYGALDGTFDMVYAPEAVLDCAIDANVPFAKTMETTEYENFVSENTDFEMDMDTMVGYIPFKVKYEIKEDIDFVGANLELKVPEQVILMEDTFTFNGEEITDYRQYSDRIFIPDIPNKGELNFSVKPTEFCDFPFYARMTIYKSDGTDSTEVIGAELFEMPELSVSAPSRTSDDTVSVGGFTNPSTAVDIYLDDEYVATTTSLKTGRYYTDITLPETTQYESYNIKAVASTSTGEKQAKTSIMYDGNTPMLESFTLEYYEHEVLKRFDMFGNDGARPNITYLPSAKLMFKISFEDNSKVENVAVVSTRGHNKKFIDAKWNEKLRCFVAEGYFDDGNMNYVPGTITVEYNTKRPEIEITDTFDPATLDPYLDDRLKDSTITVIEDSEDTYHEKIVLSDELEDLIVDEIDHVITTIDKDYSDIPLTDLMGEGEKIYNYFFDEDGDKYVLNMDYSDPENIIMIVHDISGSKLVKHAMSGIDNSDEWNPSKIRLGSEFLDSVSKYSGYIQDGYSIIKDDSDLRKQIAASNMTWAEKQEAYKKADELQSDRVAFMVATVAIGALTAPIAGPSAIAFSLLFGAVTSTSDFFWQARMGNILGGDMPFYCNWIVDPSGYVYEGITSNRLEGVTATAYWIAPEFIDENGIGDETKAVLWNAYDFEQMNPLLTDDKGQYAWNVPQGLWQVKFEKEGYETAFSEWLPVPPPQTEVHMGLISYAEPEIVSAVWDNAVLVVDFSKPVIPDSIDNIKILDKDGNKLEYTVDFDETSTNLQGVNYCKTFEFTVNGKPYSVIGNSNVKSYAEVGMPEKAVNVTSAEMYIQFNAATKTATIISSAKVTGVSVYAAAYKNDKLISIKSVTTDFSAGDTPVTFDELDLSNADTVKVMVWKTALNIKPLCNACTIFL